MLRTRGFSSVVFAIIQFTLYVSLSATTLAQEWKFRAKPRGTLKVVDLFLPSASALWNYAEGLVTLDEDNNVVPCLAKDLRWIDDKTIEFKLRRDVWFHNGEKFNAATVKINWQEYQKMKIPRPHRFVMLPDETKVQIVDDYTVRFTLPEPDGIVYHKFEWFFQVAPAFFKEHKFEENNWGRFPFAGPWGTGAFKLVEGGSRYARESKQVVLEAYNNYWDPRYPKVERIILRNDLTGNREQAMRLCRENEGEVDIVSHIRALDTLKVAESPFAKVVKSKNVSILPGWFNQRKRNSKWKDIRLRKALNYAINRDELWKYCAKGNAYNLGGFIPPGAYGHDSNLGTYNYDIVKARSLLEEAGYGDGFEVKIVASEAWNMEAQIIGKMLERIGLKAKVDIYTLSELMRKCYIPLLDKPPEEQDWDIVLFHVSDWYGNTGGTFLTFGYIEESEMRWIAYDRIYEDMWKDLARAVDTEQQEKKIKEAAKYLFDNAHAMFIYSPLCLYAVNKDIDFVPVKFEILRLKETSVTENHWSVRGKSN